MQFCMDSYSGSALMNNFQKLPLVLTGNTIIFSSSVKKLECVSSQGHRSHSSWHLCKSMHFNLNWVPRRDTSFHMAEKYMWYVTEDITNSTD